MARQPIDEHASFADRAAKELEHLTTRRDELGRELEEIQAEIRGLEAYKNAKEGKLTPNVPARKQPAQRTTPSAPRAPKGQRQQTILDLLKDNPALDRGEILAKLNAPQGSKDASIISNTLATMKGKGQLTLDGGRYNIASTEPAAT